MDAAAGPDSGFLRHPLRHESPRGEIAETRQLGDNATAMTEQDILSGAPRASGAQLWAVLDEIPARVSFIDRDRRHAYVNREYAEFVGRPPTRSSRRSARSSAMGPAPPAASAGENRGWPSAPGAG